MKKILTVLFALWSCTVFSDPASAVLQKKLNAIHTMSAQFKQVVKSKRRELSSSSGHMALSRPGRFRWHTKEPLSQLIVADGKKLWVYDIDLEQVTVKKQDKGIGGTAALFLSGYDNTVARDFDVVEKRKGKILLFDLKSKSKDANFQQVKLTFQGDALNGMELYDQLGQTTIVKLSQIKLNPKLPGKLFKFKAPKGVDVVQQ